MTDIVDLYLREQVSVTQVIGERQEAEIARAEAERAEAARDRAVQRRWRGIIVTLQVVQVGALLWFFW